MALIQCPKCNQNISDQAVKCIHCGEIILESTCKECGNKFPADLLECPNCGFPIESNNSKKNLKPQILNTIKKNKKLIIAISIALCMVILLTTIIGIASSKLNADEQFAYDIVISLRDTMSDRDAFTLYDNIYIFRHYDENGENDYTYTIFEYGAANEFGGIETETAIYKNDEFFMDYSGLEYWCNKNTDKLWELYYIQDLLLEKFDIDMCLDGDGAALGYETVIVDTPKIQKKLDSNK